MTKQYKAVFFDLDGTLRITTPSPTAAFVSFARSLNIEISPVAEHRVKVWAHHYWGQDELVKEDMARFTTEEFWLNYSKLLLETVEVQHDVQERAKAVRDWFNNEYTPHVMLAEGSYETLTWLRQEGYLVGLISNRTGPLDSAVSELGLDGLFDLTLAAGEVGYWKPNPAIFAHALNQIEGLSSQDCFYVGDNYYADGYGSELAGMIPIIFDPDDIYPTCTYRRIRHMNELHSMIQL